MAAVVVAHLFIFADENILADFEHIREYVCINRVGIGAPLALVVLAPLIADLVVGERMLTLSSSKDRYSFTTR